MNASPLSPASTPPSPPVLADGSSGLSAGSRRARRSLKYSISGICFVFGALLAVGLKAMQRVKQEEVRVAQGTQVAERQAKLLQEKLREAEELNDQTTKQLDGLKLKVAKGQVLSSSQMKALNARIAELQMKAGLTAVTGPGIRIVLKDNPEVAKANGGEVLPGMPGIVHDFDVLQVVNELRAAGADAIAVKGIRITGYTPIRCVGPAIMINGEPVPAPFVIDAVGDSTDLKAAVGMPNGIVDNLKSQGAIDVTIKTMSSLKLPEAKNLPNFRVGKAS